MNTVKTVGTANIQAKSFIGKVPQHAFDFQQILKEYNESMTNPDQLEQQEKTDPSLEPEQPEHSEQTTIDESVVSEAIKNEDINSQQAEQEAIVSPELTINPLIFFTDQPQNVSGKQPLIGEVAISTPDFLSQSMIEVTPTFSSSEDFSSNTTFNQGEVMVGEPEASSVWQAPRQSASHLMANVEGTKLQQNIGQLLDSELVVQEQSNELQQVTATAQSQSDNSLRYETSMSISEQSATLLEDQVPMATVTIPSQMLMREGAHQVAEVSPSVIEKLSQPIIEKVTTMNTLDSQKITIELLPEKMGKVQISMKVTDRQVQLEFVVENSQTKQLLESIATKLERVLQKHEFPTLMQEKVVPTTAVPTPVQGDSTFFDQSTFQQGFHQEKSKQQRFSKGTNNKSFTEMALEKIEAAPGDGSVDLLV